MPNMSTAESEQPRIHTNDPTDSESISKMRTAARLARRVLDEACALAAPGVTTDDIDAAVHKAIVGAAAYPSPLNYCRFPKSVCASVNEVICHGIPNVRPLEMGDVVSFDVSCYVNGVHGDNCATVIVGDVNDDDDTADVDENDKDWRGVPYKQSFDDPEEEARFVANRRLIKATREALYAGIDTCRPGSCLTKVGGAIHAVADQYGYDTVKKYRGHGIGHIFHCAPFVKVCMYLVKHDCRQWKRGSLFVYIHVFVSTNTYSHSEFVYIHISQ